MEAAYIPEPITSSPAIDRISFRDILRVSTAGSVDDGKSTLLGRLLYDTDNLFLDHVAALELKRDRNDSKSLLPFAMVTDGLKIEQEQGITIDVAYRYFSTPTRRIILADAPGHEQYTRNMVTAASNAHLTLLVTDITKGILTQTKRHAFLASLVGVPRLIVAVNKMDLVDYSQAAFDKICGEFLAFAERLSIKHVTCIPVSALLGDNIASRSAHMPWYKGAALIQLLEDVYIGSDENQVDLRLPIQQVVLGPNNFRGYTGTVLSGHLYEGDEVKVLPSRKTGKISRIISAKNSLRGTPSKSVTTQEAVTIEFAQPLDVARGDMVVRTKNQPKLATQLDAMVVWFDETELDLTKRYLVRHTTRNVPGYVSELHYEVDVNTLHQHPATTLRANSIGRVRISVTAPVMIDSYSENRFTGCFILVDPLTNRTAAAGMIVDRIKEDAATGAGGTPAARNLSTETGQITQAMRESRFGFAARTIWLTGLPASGKSTIAKSLESELFATGVPCYRLDGDNLRFGLTRDLGFSSHERSENVRRVAEVAKLFNDAGITVICSLISPISSDREKAREVIGDTAFTEVSVTTPLAVCEKRDPKGHYRRARSGEISDFTGVSSPYEAPADPALSLDTSTLSLEECVQKIMKLVVQPRGK